MQDQLIGEQARLPIGLVLLTMAVIDCMVGVWGYLYLNVLHDGGGLAGVSAMESTVMALLWASWWLSVGGLAVATTSAVVLPRSRELRLAIMVNAVYVLPLACVLASRYWNITENL